MNYRKLQTCIYTEDNWDLCLASQNICTQCTGTTDPTIDVCLSALTPIVCDLIDTSVCYSGCTTFLSGGWFSQSSGVTSNLLEGWTFRYGILPDYITTPLTGVTSQCVPSGITINEVYPANQGIIYYRGLDISSIDCTEITAVTEDVSISGNSFLYFDGLTECEPHSRKWVRTSTIEDYKACIKDCDPIPMTGTTSGTTSGITSGITDCCPQFVNNMFAIMITPNGAVGYKRLELSATCSGESQYYINEVYSRDGILSNTLTNLTVSFVPNNVIPEGSCVTTSIQGKLIFYIDNRQVFSTPFTEYYNSGLTYDINVGGGNIDLLCSDNPCNCYCPLIEEFTGSFTGIITKYQEYNTGLDYMDVQQFTPDLVTKC